MEGEEQGKMKSLRKNDRRAGRREEEKEGKRKRRRGLGKVMENKKIKKRVRLTQIERQAGRYEQINNLITDSYLVEVFMYPVHELNQKFV